VIVRRRMGPTAQSGVHGERANVFGEADGYTFCTVRGEKRAGRVLQLIEVLNEVARGAGVSNERRPTMMRQEIRMQT
jgi:hypothetical protein